MRSTKARRSRATLVTSVFVALGLVTAACGGSTDTAGPSTPAAPSAPAPAPAAPEPAPLFEITNIVGGAASLPIFCYVSVGDDEGLGLFREEGLIVNRLGLTGTGPALTAIAAGQADTASGTPDPLAQLIAQGVEPGISTAYIVGGKTHWEVVALPDSPYNSIADLKGAVIGVPTFGISTFPGMKRMLTEVGIDPENDVTFVAVGSGADMIRALENGDADIFAGTTFQTASAEVLGVEFKKIELSPDGQKMMGTTITMRNGLIADNPGPAGAYLRAITKGIIFMQENPEACAKIHWKIYPESKPQGVSEEEALRQSVLLITRNSEGYGPSAQDEPDVYGLVAPERWASTLAVYELADVPIEKFVDFSLIDAANDFDKAAWRAFAQAYEFKG
jgi:NitT/TauT family transport system substrate-binding protein